MRSRRLILFFVAILIGLAVGLASGWLLVPPRAPVDADLTRLRADYRSDVVLMAAEGFASHQDAVLALRWLQAFDPDPVTLIVNATAYAEAIGHGSSDLALMRALYNAITPEVVLQWREGSLGN